MCLQKCTMQSPSALGAQHSGSLRSIKERFSCVHSQGMLSSKMPRFIISSTDRRGSLYEIKQTRLLQAGQQVRAYKLPDGKCQKLTSEPWEGRGQGELRTNVLLFWGLIPSKSQLMQYEQSVLQGPPRTPKRIISECIHYSKGLKVSLSTHLLFPDIPSPILSPSPPPPIASF